MTYIERARIVGGRMELMEEDTMEEALEEDLRSALDGTAATAASSTQTATEKHGDALKLDLWLSYRPEWISKFKSESPTGRSIMLLDILQAFNDGVEGINISFSEPQ